MIKLLDTLLWKLLLVLWVIICLGWGVTSYMSQQRDALTLRIMGETREIRAEICEIEKRTVFYTALADGLLNTGTAKEELIANGTMEDWE